MQQLLKSYITTCEMYGVTYTAKTTLNPSALFFRFFKRNLACSLITYVRDKQTLRFINN